MTKNPLPLLVILLLPGCIMIHTYGPYMGKVLDKETEEPIKGAVVFMEFTTKAGHIGGSNTPHADAVEVLTDDNGDFLIPSHTIRLFRSQRWNKKGGDAIVFKPGYGVFPSKQSSINHYKKYRIPENYFVNIKLPKLKTIKERKKNLRRLSYISSEIPQEKKMFFMQLKKIEEDIVAKGPSEQAIKPSKGAIKPLSPETKEMIRKNKALRQEAIKKGMAPMGSGAEFNSGNYPLDQK